MSDPHRFTANKVVVENAPPLLALGDVDSGEIPRQSLLVMRDDEGPPWLCLVLNGQENTCGEQEIQDVELGDAELRIILKGKSLRSGAYDGPAGGPVSELRVCFSLSDAALRKLKDGCEIVFKEACAFRYVGRRLT